jgi:UDPglucose 6-dehydrogenase
LYPNLVHVPEFLTTANAIQDYLNGKFAIIGGSVKAYMNEAERIIKMSQGNLDVVHCNIGEAALAKYAINSFLATKVVFMNEIHNVAIASGLDYKKIASLMQLDQRIGSSHMAVPGTDGLYGFGGHCFPKDTEALLNFSKDLGVTMQVLESALKKNTLLRLS